MILFARVGSPYKTKGHLPPAYLDTFNFYTIPRSSSESQSWEVKVGSYMGTQEEIKCMHLSKSGKYKKRPLLIRQENHSLKMLTMTF